VSSSLIRDGLAALRDGDAANARRAFEFTLAAEGESGELLERLGDALYLQCEYAASASHYERAYATYRRERANQAAGRAARAVAQIAGNVFGDWAVQSGWFARACTILEEAREDGPDRGWVLVIRAFPEPDPARREALLREAVALGRRFGNPDLEFEALAYVGGLYIMIDLLEAARSFDRGMPARRAAALIRLADLRIRQGRLEEAAQLLEGLEPHPDAVRALAALHLARGDTALARDLLERATAVPDQVPSVPESTMVGPLLALLVDVYLEDHRVEDAARTVDRLDRVAGAQRGHYLKTLAALAEGQVRVASGTGDARASLHDALEGFARVEVPMELALTRLAMARALSERSPEVAISQAKAALESFERLEAARHADAAAALLRSLGAPVRTGLKRAGTLTRREAEVLELLGAGLSNAEIGERLYITRKTVEHHVGSLLAKLGLRNRAEAAAYATRQRISRKMGDFLDTRGPLAHHPAGIEPSRRHSWVRTVTTPSWSARVARDRRPRCCWPVWATRP
jgi:DNA-binding CsgD family transcriptional regulator